MDRSERLGSSKAFVFIENDKESSISYGTLDKNARAMAVRLRQSADVGDRVVLLCQPGLEYIQAFYACLYAGLVAVPFSPLKRKEGAGRLIKVVEDCQASVILTDMSTTPVIEGLFSEHSILQQVGYLLTDELLNGKVEDFERPPIKFNTLAFLQYTSGSTGQPKGVMISHGNIMANLRTLVEKVGGSKDVLVNWLPLFHDLGLVSIVLYPIYTGSLSVFMSPVQFVQSPVTWFKAITKYKGTICCAPNFAYEHCINEVKSKDWQDLDLSSWRVAVNGAEPIQNETLAKFTSYFSKIGFSHSTFSPTYGMAEATVFISCASTSSLPVVTDFNVTELKNNKAVKNSTDMKGKLLVGCGSAGDNHEIKIVNLDTKQEQQLGGVGEIWVSGPSLSTGYWGKDELNRLNFKQAIKHEAYSSEGQFVYYRTGDLGFIFDGELYITGRIKDLMIFRGLNHYPQDIEWEIENCHEDIRQSSCAAFSIETTGNSEELVAAVEVERKVLRHKDFKSIFRAIREVVYAKFELKIYAIVLLKPGASLKTSSGKIKRNATKSAYLNKQLRAIETEEGILQAEYIAPKNDIEQTLCVIWQDILKIERVGTQDNFFEMGGHSLIATKVISRIRVEFNVELELRCLFEQPTVESLAIVLENLSNSLVLPDLIPVERANALALSYAQQRLWFIDQYEGGSSHYNMPGRILLNGALDLSAFSESVKALIERHEILRTTYHKEDGVGFMQIHASYELPYEQYDLTGLSDEAQLIEVLKMSSAHQYYVFDLQVELPIRLSLLKLSDNEHLILFNMHHIASDGWSITILQTELSCLYNAFSQRLGNPLLPLRIQYADYAMWQRSWLEGELLEKQLVYWRSRLADIPVIHSLPLDQPRPGRQSFEGAVHQQLFGKDLNTRIQQFCQLHDVTLYMFLQTVFSVLLARHSGETDIVMGTPIAGRSHVDLEPLIGFFVNSLVLRSDLSSNPTFAELLRTNKGHILDAFEHQHVQFEMLVEELEPPRSPSHSPLFQIVFALQNNEQSQLNFAEIESKQLTDVEGTEIKFDLELNALESGGEIQFSWLYNIALFEPETIARLASGLSVLVENILEDVNQAVQTVPVLSAAETQRILIDWNDTETKYPADKCIHSLFEEQVANAPNRIALVHADKTLSYGELNASSNRLAHYLIEKGIGPDNLVGLCVERSFEWVIGVLAILKAGGAYVPLDPAYPKDRQRFMLEDSGVRIVLSQNSLTERLVLSGVSEIILMDDLRSISGYPDLNPESVVVGLAANHLAYLIYTSGSTGRPKGVMIEHRSVNRLLLGVDYVDLGPDSVFLQAASSSFDAMTFELWGALLHGGKAVLYPEDIPTTERLGQELKHNQVSHLFLSTGLFNAIADTDISVLSGLKQLLVGGDALSVQKINLAGNMLPDVRLMNIYGPTESTTFACCYQIDRTKTYYNSVPIGRPIANTQVYVLSAELQPVPIGAPGELFIGGDGLARGYLNEPDLTAEKFINNPFSDLDGARLYRTGDLVRYTVDGQLNFICRIDRQVKVRGFRIELGEIEAALIEASQVKQAVVIAISDNDNPANKQLVAYVVPTVFKADSEDTSALIKTLSDFLKLSLPNYMVPVMFVVLGELPLTSNGKLDHEALPDPEQTNIQQTEYVGPKNDIEKALCVIWQDILKIDRVGTQDNFFELGGDSILSIQVVSRAKIQGITLTVRQLFEHPTVLALAPCLNQKPVLIAMQEAVQRRQVLLPIQRRFFEQGLVEQDHFNQSMLLQTPAEFTTEHLEALLLALYHRHDVLRLRFSKNNIECEWIGEYLPYNDQMVCDSVFYQDLSIFSEEQRGIKQEESCDALQGSLNIHTGPIFKAGYFDYGSEQGGRLLLVLHHLVVDGVSWSILRADIELAYKQLLTARKVELAPKSSSYQQWGEALSEYAVSESVLMQRPFWYKQLSHPVGLLPGLVDQITAASSVSRHEFSMTLSATETQLLIGECNKAYRTRINELLLSALLHSYQKWSGQDSLRIYMESHGREELFESLGITDTIGWFTTVYPLVISSSLKKDYGNLIKSVKEQYRALPNTGIGFGVLTRIVEDSEFCLLEKHQVGQSIVFNYLGQFDRLQDDHSVFKSTSESSGLNSSAKQSQHELISINGLIVDGKLTFRFTGRTDGIAPQATAEFCETFKNALQDCVAWCRQKNSRSSMMALRDQIIMTEKECELEGIEI
ncbi:MAG: amino acid adenylation domain-containing protein [Pseudomonadales bacterium]|nr:amino acid adenylation domain-containing protein [Pseudomonadales bacterium]